MIDEYNAQNLAQTAWAFANLGIRNVELLETIGSRAISPEAIPKFNIVGIVTITYSFVQLDFNFDPLLPLFAHQIVSTDLQLDVTPTQAALMASTWAKAGIRDEKLFDVLANRAMIHGMLGHAGITRLCTAFASFELYYPEMMDYLAYRASLQKFTAPEIAEVVWSFAYLQHYDRDMFAMALENLGAVWMQLTAKETPKLVWGFSMLGKLGQRENDPQLIQALRVLAAIVVKPEVITAFNYEECVSMCWSFLVAQLSYDSLLSALLASPAVMSEEDMSELGRSQLKDVRDYVYSNRDAFPRTVYTLESQQR
jgi:hypothetical protein